MANEIRLRSNNQQGTITNNPLTAGATTINSPGFIDLPVVDTTNHLILVLDPLEVNGAAEIVRVTAHASTASSLTVVRGAENTTPREHPFGTTWFHGPVTSDFVPTLATSGARPAVPFTQQTIFETDTERVMRYTGTAWQQGGLYWDPPACRAFHNTTQSIPHNSTTALVFNSERFDTDNMHDTAVNSGRITFNTAGLYLVTATIELATATDYTAFLPILRLNGSTSIDIGGSQMAAGAQVTIIGKISTIYKFAAAEWVDIAVIQANGAAAARNVVSNANRSPEFSATWIGRGN